MINTPELELELRMYFINLLLEIFKWRNDKIIELQKTFIQKYEGEEIFDVLSFEYTMKDDSWIFSLNNDILIYQHDISYNNIPYKFNTISELLDFRFEEHLNKYKRFKKI